MKLRKYLLFLCLIGTAVFGQTILVNTFTFVLGYQKDGRVVDLYAPITSSDTTVSDQSGNGLDATLLSGRYPTLDASADTITYATDYASALRTATVMMRVTSTGNRTITSGSGTFTFTPTATGVWELLTAPAVTVAGDLSWTAGPDCDISDLRIYEGGVEVDRWIHAELESGDPDGLPVANSIRPLATGTYTGGSFSSGEPTILQTAGMDYNVYSWFNGTDTYVETSHLIVANTSVKFEFSLVNGAVGNDNMVAGAWSKDIQGSADNRCLFIKIKADGTLEVLTNPTGIGIGNAAYTFDCDLNDSISHDVVLTFTANSGLTLLLDGVPISGSGSVRNVLKDSDITFKWGNHGGTTSSFTGLLYNRVLTDDGVIITSETPTGTFRQALVPVSDTDPTLDALGNALTFQRTPKTLNLTDGASAQIAAPVPDTIKTVAFWLWHDGRAKTHIDGGNWTVGSTTTALTSTGFTGAAYFVNGVSGTTLVAGWNHVMVASTAALTTADIDFTNVQEHFVAYNTTEGADTALRNYNATKSDYGL